MSTKLFMEVIEYMGTSLLLLDLTGTNLPLATMPNPGLRWLNLLTLTLAHCPKVDLDLLRLLQFCGPSLKTLNLSASHIVGEELTKGDLTLINLEHLKIFNSKYISNRGLKVILELCGPNMKSIDLGSTEITGHGLYASNIRLCNLQTLNLSGCNNINGHGLSEIIRSCGSNLKVSYCL